VRVAVGDTGVDAVGPDGQLDLAIAWRALKPSRLWETSRV
jgi:hypothetical protein